MSEMQQDGYDRTYCYPNTNVLVNKLGIRDMDSLHKSERMITGEHLAKIRQNPVKGDLDFNQLKKIHQTLFSDIYPWAGEIRTVNIAKGELFCRPEFIPQMAASIFTELKQEKYLIGLRPEDASKRLAYYMGEINAMHPFREGNGRTQRVFMQNLANVAGYELYFTKISKDEMIKASIKSFDRDYTQMQNIFDKSLMPLTIVQHSKIVMQLTEKKSPVYKELLTYFQQTVAVAHGIKQAGFQSTNKLVSGLMAINKAFGKDISVKELKELHSKRHELPEDKKDLVDKVVGDFKQQEIRNNQKSNGLDRQR